jgi:hypothetical protein
VSEHFPKDTENIFRPSGQKVQLKVTLSDPAGCSYQWYLLQERGTESGKILAPVPAPLVGNGPMIEVPVGSSKVQYVCEIQNSLHRKTFSSVFSVSPDFSEVVAIPSISSISPASPNTDASGSELVTVTGRGFQASANTTVVLTSPSGVVSTYIPTVTSSAELSFSHSFTGQPGPWSLVVKKGTNASAAVTFQAISATPGSVPHTLSRITIDNLPGTVFEGQTISNARIHAYFTDTEGLVSLPTAANWNIQPSVISFSSPHSLVVGQVTSDTTASITATYTEGGVTKTSPAYQITIRDNTSSGGVVTGEIVKNGIFADIGNYWSNSNEDFHINSDYSFGGHTGGYAWLATPAGAKGNYLKGTISQVIDLPSNASVLRLKFSCAISVQDTSALTTADNLIVRLADENGSNAVVLKTISPVGNPEAQGQWADFAVDLMAYKGSRKKLIFGGNTDYSNPATVRVDDVRVEVTATGPTLVDLTITGADLVKEGASSSFKALANSSDGTAADVTGAATWTVNENASISGGILNASQVAGQKTARITASYSSGGISKSASKDVTILDTAPVPVSLAIYGPSQVDENSGGTFNAVLLLSTGVYQEVTGSVYWSFVGTGGQVDPIGRLYTNEVASDTVLTVKASYEKDGLVVTAETPLTIMDRLPPVLPSSMVIVGPSSVDEAGTGLFDTEVTYADGSKKLVPASWQENSRFATISEYGVFVCEQVLSNQVVTLTASFTEHTSTVTAAKSVTIANIRNTEAKPEIIMPASIEVPVDRQLNLRLQTAHPAVSATATGLPSGLTFNNVTFEIQGIPADVGTWEIQLSATNDFGTSSGILLLTVSEDAGPEWIRFTKAAPVTVPADGMVSDGEGGCYLYGYNSIAHRNAVGVIDYNSGTIGMGIFSASATPNGFAITGSFYSTFTVGGRTITKFPNGEGEAVLIVFNKSGQAVWHETARCSRTNTYASVVTLNTDGSIFWGVNYRENVSVPNLGIGIDLVNESNPGQMDCALIRINPDRSFGWGHRWGGTQQDEIIEIVPITSTGCRVKISSLSSSVTRHAIGHPGLFTTTWNKGNSSGTWHLFETATDRSGFAEAQLDSPDAYAYTNNFITDPIEPTKFWLAGNFRTTSSFKRFQDGASSENISLPAATNEKMSGFVIKSGFSVQPSSTVLFRSLAPSVYGVNEVFVRRIAPMSDGSVLSVGTYTPSFDYNGSKLLDSPQDYAQTQPNKRAFIAGHDSTNSMKWVLPCGGIDGGIPTRLESVGNDKWVMLCNSNGDAKFGRLPVISGGGLIIVDIERKLPQLVMSETYESWLSGGLSAGELATLSTGGNSYDLNQNGKSDLLDYAFGATTVFDLPSSDPICSWVTNPDTTQHLAITFDRALGRSDSKIAVEISDGLSSWLTGSVYAIGADTPDTGLTTEVSRVNMGSYERITVADKRPATGTRFMRIKATTGPTPIPSSAP